MSMLPPWKVVETRYARNGQVERVIHHTRLGSWLMSETDARRFADQEMGRYANALPKRTFRAEPITVLPKPTPEVSDVATA